MNQNKLYKFYNKIKANGITFIHFSILIIFTSCHAQEKNALAIPNNSNKLRPAVIKNFRTTTPDFDTTLVSQYIRSIFQDSKGNLWFGTIDEGVVKYDKKTLTYFSAPDGFVNNSVFAIAEDKMGNLWFGTDQGVYKYDGKAFKHFDVPISIMGMLEDRKGNLWLGGAGGLYRINQHEEIINVTTKGPW